MSRDEAECPIPISSEEWRIVRSLLKRYVPECTVWAFGSRTKRSFRAYSDLDLVIIGEGPIGIARMAELAEAFSESALPWKVDLLDWAEASDSFRGILEKEKVVLQEKGKPTLSTP